MKGIGWIVGMDRMDGMDRTEGRGKTERMDGMDMDNMDKTDGMIWMRSVGWMG